MQVGFPLPSNVPEQPLASHVGGDVGQLIGIIRLAGKTKNRIGAGLAMTPGHKLTSLLSKSEAAADAVLLLWRTKLRRPSWMIDANAADARPKSRRS